MRWRSPVNHRVGIPIRRHRRDVHFGADVDCCGVRMGGYERVVGDALRARTKGRQMTEVAIAVASLNRMLELGRPEYLRLS